METELASANTVESGNGDKCGNHVDEASNESRYELCSATKPSGRNIPAAAVAASGSGTFAGDLDYGFCRLQREQDDRTRI